MPMQEYQLDHAAFDLWLMGEGEDNWAELERVKTLLPIVLNECCTDIQKEYIMLYFADKMQIKHIAEQFGVNPSTVLRTIRRGIDRVFRALRFSSPLFIKAPKRLGRLPRNGGRP